MVYFVTERAEDPWPWCPQLGVLRTNSISKFIFRSGESKPPPKKPQKTFRGPKMSEFSPERLIQVRSGAQCTKHYPTPYTYPLPVISDWNQGRALKVCLGPPKQSKGPLAFLQFLGPKFILSPLIFRYLSIFCYKPWRHIQMHCDMTTL